MQGTDGILADYLPLQIFTIDDVYEGNVDEDNEDAEDDARILSRSNFEWIRYCDRRKSSQQQLFDGTAQQFCATKRRAKTVTTLLDGELLRLPQASYCSGWSSVMLANELLQELGLSANLGIIQTPATIVDGTQTKREGYTALSFHKRFTLERVNQRIAKLPAEQRSLICLQHDRHSNFVLIHKAALERWQALGVTCVKYEFSQEQQNLTTMLTGDHYHGYAGEVSYNSLADFQQNKDRRIWVG